MAKKRLGAFDVGNVDTKVMSSTGGDIFRSVVAHEQGALLFEGFGRDGDFVIEFEGKRIAIGETAYKLGRLQVSEMGQGRIDSDMYRQLLAAGMVSVFGTGCNVAAVVSLPVKFYTGSREGMRDFIAGTYKVGMGDRTRTFKLKPDDVHIVPEGFGAICSIAMDGNGRVVNGRLSGMNVGVVDVGGRTTDLLYFSSLDLVPTKSTGEDQVGVTQLWLWIGELINARYKRSLSEPQIDEAIRRGYFRSEGETIRIDKEVAEASRAFADAVHTAISRQWDDGKDADLILLAGGGANLIAPYLGYRHAVLINQEEYGVAANTANVEGAFRFGLYRKFAE
jgi:hypothetical protein